MTGLLSRWWKKSRWNWRNGRGISILVPFHCPDEKNRRSVNWRWLKKYWQCHLPGAEIIVGSDPFAVPIFRFPNGPWSTTPRPVLKATSLLSWTLTGTSTSIRLSIVPRRIREARKKGQRLWYVPYRQFYRLTDAASWKVLDSDPCYHPYQFPMPPNPKTYRIPRAPSLGTGMGR